MAALTVEQRAAFQADLNSGGRQAASAAQMYTEMSKDFPPQCIVKLYSNMYVAQGEVGDYI